MYRVLAYISWKMATFKGKWLGKYFRPMDPLGWRFWVRSFLRVFFGGIFGSPQFFFENNQYPYRIHGGLRSWGSRREPHVMRSVVVSCWMTESHRWILCPLDHEVGRVCLWKILAGCFLGVCIDIWCVYIYIHNIYIFMYYSPRKPESWWLEDEKNSFKIVSGLMGHDTFIFRWVLYLWWK